MPRYRVTEQVIESRVYDAVECENPAQAYDLAHDGDHDYEGETVEEVSYEVEDLDSGEVVYSERFQEATVPLSKHSQVCSRLNELSWAVERSTVWARTLLPLAQALLAQVKNRRDEELPVLVAHALRGVRRQVRDQILSATMVSELTFDPDPVEELRSVLKEAMGSEKEGARLVALRAGLDPETNWRSHAEEWYGRAEALIERSGS